MSTVFVHVGQCGNQIGQEFWSKSAAIAEQSFNVKRAFWTPGWDRAGHIRGVFIDSEKKVLQKLFDQAQKVKKKFSTGLQFGHGNLISSATGCGSNWALGHNRLPQQRIVNPWPLNTYSFSHEFDYGEEDSMLKATMEAVRREVESCDCFSGFVTWQSLGGGTGSGFGSRLSTELRDRYPVAYQLSIAVTPHTSGDCPTQPYNETLSLSALQRNSDAIIIFENDEVLNLLASKSQSVSYEKINSHIANCMINLLAPVSNLTPPNGVTVGIEPWELIRSVAPMHNLKLLHCRTVQEPKHTSAAAISWDKLVNQICQQTRTQFLNTNPESRSKISTLSAVCVCRNLEKQSKKIPGSDLDIAKLASIVKNTYQCVKWNPFPVDVWTDEAIASKLKVKNPKSLTICSNLSTLGTVHCSHVLHSAQLKFKAKAYLHWYERYGTYAEDFEQAFEVVHNIINEYKEATET